MDSKKRPLQPHPSGVAALIKSLNPHLIPNPTPAESTSNAAYTCPECGKDYVAGAPICLGCGLLFTRSNSTTTLLTQPEAPVSTEDSGGGRVLIPKDRGIYLEVDGERIPLPVQMHTIIGREPNPVTDFKRPDIALNAFGAEQKGVSRQHICITRNRNVLYVTDLGSSNGTLLNGMRIPYRQTRILRDGDELRLGTLKLQLRF